MSAEKDRQIFWIVVLAIAFWLAAWKHEFTVKLVHNVSNRLMDLFR